MSKIIEETDFRYNNLESLFNRWNFNNFRIRLTREYQYIIPKELMLDPSIDEFYIGKASNFIWNYLRLTLQEYFDLLVLHINDTEDRPKCQYCGNPIIFSGELARGYSRHKWEDTYNIFCSAQCRQYYIHSHLDEYPHEIDRRLRWRDLVSLDKLRQARSSMNRLLNRGTIDDIIYFYYGKISEETLKYGITECFHGRNNHIHLIEYKVYEFTRAKCCLIEYLIKLKLKDINENITEYVDIKYKDLFYDTINSVMAEVNEFSENKIIELLNDINS